MTKRHQNKAGHRIIKNELNNENNKNNLSDQTSHEMWHKSTRAKLATLIIPKKLLSKVQDHPYSIWKERECEWGGSLRKNLQSLLLTKQSFYNLQQLQNNSKKTTMMTAKYYYIPVRVEKETGVDITRKLHKEKFYFNWWQLHEFYIFLCLNQRQFNKNKKKFHYLKFNLQLFCLNFYYITISPSAG